MKHKSMNLDELIKRREILFDKMEKATTNRLKHNYGACITAYTKRIDRYYYEAIAFGRISTVLENSVEAIQEWNDGLCRVKCSADNRAIGACTCYNIAVQKSWDAGLKLNADGI